VGKLENLVQNLQTIEWIFITQNSLFEATLKLTRWQRVGHIITLVVLAPVIAEVHFGAIRITTIFALKPASRSDPPR
jgi:hypothetical protein